MRGVHECSRPAEQHRWAVLDPRGSPRAQLGRILSRGQPRRRVGARPPTTTTASTRRTIIGAGLRAGSPAACSSATTGRLGPVVYGLEGDLGELGLGGSSTQAYVPFIYNTSTSTDIDFYMTLRGRLGILFNQWLLYGTFGYIGADTTASVVTACTFPPCTVAVNAQNKFFATAGPSAAASRPCSPAVDSARVPLLRLRRHQRDRRVERECVLVDARYGRQLVRSASTISLALGAARHGGVTRAWPRMTRFISSTSQRILKLLAMLAARFRADRPSASATGSCVFPLRGTALSGLKPPAGAFSGSGLRFAGMDTSSQTIAI